MNVGEVICAPGSVVLNEGRATVEVDVATVGDRPVQVGSHLHFFEANRCQSFDRAAAYGYRLDVPSGTSVRFEPGEVKRVRLTALAGARRAFGLNGLASGALDAPDAAEAALARAARRGFLAYEPGVAVGFDGKRYALGGAARADGQGGAVKSEPQGGGCFSPAGGAGSEEGR